VTDRLAIVADDPWLAPHEPALRERRERFQAALGEVRAEWGSLRGFATAHREFGVQRDDAAGGWRYREWAPRAESLSLVGDFNGWDGSAHPLGPVGSGVWEVFLPDAAGRPVLRHGDRFKVRVVGANGARDRIPPMARRVVQDPDTLDFAAEVWAPPEPFAWSDGGFAWPDGEAPLIYECHVGMAQEAERVGTYREFAEHVLPRVAALGYNAIQLMAVAEHPYYGSFGYHVANFFAPSSRFGTPDDLRALIDRAHALGIAVLLDLVHSHAVRNLAEGPGEFDGAEGLYFHAGGRGYHRGWDSLLFDYGSPPVRRFLLSNVAYWLEEFHFDGFRFDGVTSMLYHHHGDIAFDHLGKYFDGGVDLDAVTYLQLANALAHEVNPAALTVAEDFSGMPGLCRPVDEGGVGFDYRLGMGIPDAWIRLLKHLPDEAWHPGEIWSTLTNRRRGEKTVAYAESHDQALVGDKTIAFWLMDAAMYWHMQAGDDDPVVARGVALHKMIRLVTLALGGEAYLTFMGNEFGHPEWVDFPREGNGWSYRYARRQWHLADDPRLKYQFLQAFDAAMVGLARRTGLLRTPPAQQLNIDADNQCLVFERGDLVFAFNFHPTRSLPDYRFTAHRDGDFTVALSSDAAAFGGTDRIDTHLRYPAPARQMSVYLPSRTAAVFAPAGGR
jgi:1,4-alpha-glucan branching enzyme